LAAQAVTEERKEPGGSAFMRQDTGQKGKFFPRIAGKRGEKNVTIIICFAKSYVCEPKREGGVSSNNYGRTAWVLGKDF